MTLPHDCIATLKYDCPDCIETAGPCATCNERRYVTNEVELASFLGSMHADVGKLVDHITQRQLALDETQGKLSDAWREINHMRPRYE